MFEGIFEKVVAGAVLGIVALVLRQPRPLSFLFNQLPTVRKLLGTPDSPPRDPTPQADQWEHEVEDFRDAAAEMWTTLVPRFEQAGFFGEGSARSGLGDVVRGAPWPDYRGDEDFTSALCQGALGDFCERACARSGERLFGDTRAFLTFDGTRRNIADILRKWANRKDAAGFLDWLRDQNRLDWPRRGPSSPTPYLPYHASTLKLLWYLELAVARESGNESASYAFVPTLRDSLSGAASDLLRDGLTPE